MNETITVARQKEIDEAEARRVEQVKKRLGATAVAPDDPRVAAHVATLKEQGVANAEDAKAREEALNTAREAARDAAAALTAAQEAVAAAVAKRDEAAAKHAAALAQLNTLTLAAQERTPAELLAPGEPTVLMFFPRDTMLVARGTTVTFPAGIQPVPETLHTHWFLVDSGVRLYSGDQPATRVA